jgi:predicted ATPase
MQSGLISRPALRLDLADEQAWLGDEPLRLTPKAFGVLRHLVVHRDRLVTKTELFRELWPGTTVSDGVLTTVVREIRKALGEGSQGPGTIQTVHRRGYRFIGAVQDAAPVDVAPAPLIVGRDGELGRLRQVFQSAQAGARQIMFVTGEPGIGKTALTDAFLVAAAAAPEVSVARGQCIERYGAAEAYQPWLDALGQLCRRSGGERVVAVLRRAAPMWLAQMPALLDAGERAALQREVADAPPERMLRELCEALELLTADRPLVIALEDVHWIDQSSLDLFAAVARRREPARLLVLATYRPVEVNLGNHPLKRIKQELQAHRQCAELALEFLSPAAIGDYLAARFPGVPGELAPVVHRRSDGNALFMVNMADYLAGRGLITEGAGRWELRGEMAAVEAVVPESLRGMIDRQLERLSDEERGLVQAASVAGVEFADASVAPTLDAPVERIGACCADLARRGLFLRPAADEDWADGTGVRRYAFIHALYADVLYDALPPSIRQRLHRIVGERLETGYGKRAGTIAAELALHFERARDYARAVTYLTQAAANASQRLAFVEVIRALTRALELLPNLPDGKARKQQELTIRMSLAPALMTTKGYAAPEVDAVYAGADELCQQVGEDWQTFSVWIGRCGSLLLGARTDLAKQLAEQSLALAQRRQSPRYLTQAESALGIIQVWRGEFAPAAAHLAASRVAYEAVDQPAPGFRLLHDPGSSGRAYAAWAFWMLGFPDRAQRESAAAIALGRKLAHPFSLAFALAFGAFVHQARREIAATRERAEETIALCAEHGFAMYHAVAMVFRGWAMAEAGEREAGLAEMEAGRVAYAATGAVLVQPYYAALIAEAQARCGMADQARTRLAWALGEARRTGERVYEAELTRLMGELDAAEPGRAVAAEAAFRDALRIARDQQALGLELRAGMSLARLWRASGRDAEACALLSPIHARFTEGHDTQDLRDAMALIEQRVVN